MITETSHRAGLAPNAIRARRVESFCPHERDRNRAVEACVMGPVHALASAFTDEILDLVSTAAE
jgi:hypothetical protein